MRTKETAVLGLLLTVALVLSYIETLIPFFAGVPGMKAGLPNLIVVLLLFADRPRAAVLVNLTRILLVGFLFGGFYGILFSLAGGALSFVVMAVLKRTGRFSATGVSVAGGVSHNVAQLLIAAFVVRTSGILYFTGPLLIAGALTGAVLGLIATRVSPLLQKHLSDNKT